MLAVGVLLDIEIRRHGMATPVGVQLGSFHYAKPSFVLEQTLIYPPWWLARRFCLFEYI